MDGQKKIQIITFQEFLTSNFTCIKELELCAPFLGDLSISELQSSHSFLVAKCRLWPGHDHYFIVWNVNTLKIVNVLDINEIVVHGIWILDWQMNDSFLCFQMNSNSLVFHALTSCAITPLQTKSFDGPIQAFGLNETHLFVSVYDDDRLIQYQIE